jgi:hypothetical protein
MPFAYRSARLSVGAGDNFAERFFVATSSEVAQQLGIGPVVHSPIKQPRGRKSDREFDRSNVGRISEIPVALLASTCFCKLI